MEVVEDGEHGEAVRGGVRVHAAAEGEAEAKLLLAVAAEELEYGACGRVLLEDTVESAGPGCVHGLEAVEAAQVGGGDEAGGRALQDVDEELGVEALHVGWGCVCAGGPSAIFLGLIINVWVAQHYERECS